MRLNKFLAESALGARRKVEEIIKSGRVKVNNSTVTNLATEVEPEEDVVKVDGKVVSVEPKVYIMLNKPAGYLTTVADERGRKTVLDLVKVKERIFPVGRLDKDSTGLLLLTNDGDLAAKLLHPRHKIPKTYIVKADRALSEKHLKRFRQGIMLDDRKTAPAQIKMLTSHPRLPEPGTGGQVSPLISPQSYLVTLRQGRKRQIRRMFEALGRKILDLKRIQIGPLKLAGLKEGHWRYLTTNELKHLKER